MLKRIFALSFAILFISQLSGCATPPPNVPICAEINPSKAACVMTMTGQEYIVDDDHTINGQTYWEMRPAMLLMPAASWAAIKAWIIKVCHKNKKMCDDAVGNWERQVHTVDDNVKSRLP